MNLKPLPLVLVIVLAATWGASLGAVIAVAYMLITKPVALGVFMAGSGLAGLLVIPFCGAAIGAPNAAVLALAVRQVANHSRDSRKT